MQTKMGKYLCELDPDNPRATKEGYVYTHVLVAEKKLGRYLAKEECVHHVDFDKYNNNPENLMVFKTRADHSAFHCGVPAVQEEDVWWCPTKGEVDLCPVCSSPKCNKAQVCVDCYRKDSALKRVDSFVQTTQFDSDDFDNITALPNREMLKGQIRTMSFEQVGRLYGVTGNTIKKWCQKYQLFNLSHAIHLIPNDEWESEIISDKTRSKIEEHYNRVSSDVEIVEAYFKNPKIAKIAEQFHKDHNLIKKILLDRNIRVLNASESGNINPINQCNEYGEVVGSFLTVMDAAKWILENGYGGNNHKAKKISYLISKKLDVNESAFGFLWATNDTITNYKEYLLLNDKLTNDLSHVC